MQTLMANFDTPLVPLGESFTNPALHTAGLAPASTEEKVPHLVALARSLTSDPQAYSGHLGVLRPEGVALERQRRYDFWFKHP